MALVSMNIADDDYVSTTEYDSSPCVYLTEAQCAALGLTTPPAAGTTVMVTARAIFTSVTQRADGEEDDPDVCVSLKITDMQLGSVGSGGASLY